MSTPMSTPTQLRDERIPSSAVQSGRGFRTGDQVNYKAWVAKAAKQWNVPAEKLVAGDGKVTDPASGKSLRRVSRCTDSRCRQ